MNRKFKAFIWNRNLLH